jgi:tetratricopeptide (TPR) repeat protein
MSKHTGLPENLRANCARHECAQVIDSLEEVTRLEPQNARASFTLGFCYSGGCRTHSLVDVEIAISHFRQALVRLRDGEDSLLRAQILGALGNAYCDSSQLTPTARLETAIWCYEQAAASYARSGKLTEWAREQYNLGNAWCDLPASAFPEKWSRAITCYEAALSIRTPMTDPTARAATLQNLGTAWRELPTGDKTRNVARAIQCYRRALRVRGASAAPLKSAALHNNLGNAYLTLPASDEERRKRNATRALRHFDRALTVRTAQRCPGDYAITQFNRGSAFLRLAEGNSGTREELEKSFACFEEADRNFLDCGYEALAEAARENMRRVQTMLMSARSTPPPISPAGPHQRNSRRSAHRAKSDARQSAGCGRSTPAEIQKQEPAK